jgi:hypothetical protein
MYLLIAFLLILFEQIAHGLETAGHKTLAGMVFFVFLASVYLMIFAWVTGKKFPFKIKYIPLWQIIIGVVLVRFGIGDLIWNISAGQSIFYIGNTKVYDFIMGWLVNDMKMQLNLIWFAKAIALFWGVAWLLGWKDGIVRLFKKDK